MIKHAMKIEYENIIANKHITTHISSIYNNLPTSLAAVYIHTPRIKPII